VGEVPDEGGRDVVQFRGERAERLQPLEVFHAFLQMLARRPLWQSFDCLKGRSPLIQCNDQQLVKGFTLRDG
jgi:hypothetical protein